MLATSSALHGNRMKCKTSKWIFKFRFEFLKTFTTVSLKQTRRRRKRVTDFSESVIYNWLISSIFDLCWIHKCWEISWNLCLKRVGNGSKLFFSFLFYEFLNFHIFWFFLLLVFPISFCISQHESVLRNVFAYFKVFFLWFLNATTTTTKSLSRLDSPAS